MVVSLGTGLKQSLFFHAVVVIYAWNNVLNLGIVYCPASLPNSVKVGVSGLQQLRLPQVKSVKPCLKQLQQCIQTISTLHDDEILPSNPADLFHWLPKEHMCVLVYLVRSSFLLHMCC